MEANSSGFAGSSLAWQPVHDLGERFNSARVRSLTSRTIGSGSMGVMGLELARRTGARNEPIAGASSGAAPPNGAGGAPRPTPTHAPPAAPPSSQPAPGTPTSRTPHGGDARGSAGCGADAARPTAPQRISPAPAAPSTAPATGAARAGAGAAATFSLHEFVYGKPPAPGPSTLAPAADAGTPRKNRGGRPSPRAPLEGRQGRGGRRPASSASALL